VNPQLLANLMQALGYTDKAEPRKDIYQADADKAKSFLNSLAFNQGPKIEAATDTFLSGKGYWSEGFKPTYDQALEEAYARKRAMEARSPTETSVGSLLGSVAQPINFAGGGPLRNIATNAALTGLEQSGEQGADLATIQGAGLLGGGATAAFESLPLVGKALRGFQGILQEAGLGLRGAAMKKAGSKVKDKNVLGEGYDLIRNMLKSGEGPEEAIRQAEKVMTGSANRAANYVEIADAKIKELVQKQEDIAIDVTNKVFKTTKLGKNKMQLPRNSMPSIEFDINNAKSFQAGVGTGRLTSNVTRKNASQFEKDYLSLVSDILTSQNSAKAAKVKPAVNLEDLIVLRRDLSKNYDQYAKSGKGKVYTAVVDDLNRAITNNLKKFEDAGKIAAGTADEFKKAGKDMERLITFNDAVALSSAGKKDLAKSGDLASVVTSGGGLSMAAYFAGVSNPLLATAVGSFGSMAPVQGALGRGLEKSLDFAEDTSGISRSLSNSAIRTGVPIEGEAPEQNMSMPQQTSSGDTLSSRLMADFGAIPTQPSSTPSPAPQSLSERLLADFNSPPQSADITDTSSPANGDLPSQQLGLKQDVSLSQPDKFGGLAQYYAALGQTESSLNPMAKNPTSSAKGLFQFIDSTAKNVGLQDPFEKSQSLAAVQNLTNQHRQQFGDNPELLYGAHYLGQPTLAAWLSGQPLEPQQAQNVQSFVNAALPRFRNQLAAVQQPESPIMQQFMSLYQ